MFGVGEWGPVLPFQFAQRWRSLKKRPSRDTGTPRPDESWKRGKGKRKQVVGPSIHPAPLNSHPPYCICQAAYFHSLPSPALCLLAFCYCSCFQTAMALDRLINLQICPHSVFCLPSPKHIHSYTSTAHIPTYNFKRTGRIFPWNYSLRCYWLPPLLWNSITAIRDFKWTTSTGSLLRVMTSTMAQFYGLLLLGIRVSCTGPTLDRTLIPRRGRLYPTQWRASNTPRWHLILNKIHDFLIAHLFFLCDPHNFPCFVHKILNIVRTKLGTSLQGILHSCHSKDAPMWRFWIPSTSSNAWSQRKPMNLNFNHGRSDQHLLGILIVSNFCHVSNFLWLKKNLWKKINNKLNYQQTTLVQKASWPWKAF